MTGAELNSISDDELAMVIGDYSVFARVTPEHKVRIVNAFERRGEVVAMTATALMTRLRSKRRTSAVQWGRAERTYVRAQRT